MNLFFGICGQVREDVVGAALGRVRAALSSYPVSYCNCWRSATAGFLECSFRGDTADLPAPGELSSERYSLVSAGERCASLASEKIALRHPHNVKFAASSESVAKAAFLDDGRAFLQNADEVTYAVWDSCSGLLYAQRDSFGVVPFYYCMSKGAFYFSNELRLLRAGMLRQPDWNDRCIVARIQAVPLPVQETSYLGIFRLPSGSALTWSPSEGISVDRYYNLGAHRVEVSSSFQDNSNRLRDLLFKSVEKRLPVNGAVGVELSGGLDSTAISGILAKQSPEQLESFSAVFPGHPDCDESEYISAAVEYQGLKNESFDATSLDLVAAFEESVRDYSEIHYAANIHIARHIQDLALAAGCRRIFNGIDGDNVASHGLFLLRELAEADRWIAFGRETRRISDLFSTHFADPRLSLFAAYGRGAFQRAVDCSNLGTAIFAAACLKIYLGFSLGRSFRFIRRRKGRSRSADPDCRSRVGRFTFDELNPDLASSGQYVDYIRALQTGELEPRSEREAQINVLTKGVNESYFELIHSLSLKRGLQTVCPFMDRELIEFCINVPVQHKLRDGWNRAFLRNGLRAIYPPEIYSRRFKSNLAPAAYARLKDECVENLRERVQEPAQQIWRYFDRGCVKAMLLHVQSAGKNDTRLLGKIWVIWATARSMEILEEPIGVQ